MKNFCGRLIGIVSVFLVLAASALAGTQKLDLQVSEKLLIAVLEDAEQNFDCKPDCVHEIIGQYSIKLKSGRRLLIVTATDNSETGGCHACGKSLSFFMYEEKDGQWTERWQKFAGLERGESGEFSGDQISIHQLGADRYGLFLQNHFFGNARNSSVMEVFLEQNNGFKRVLSVCTFASNEPSFDPAENTKLEWRARFIVLPKNKGLADIVFDLHDPINKPDSRSLFVFDGKHYTAANPDKRLIGAGCAVE